jgi:hypothetical protein
MNDEDTIATYNSLAEILRDSQLTWLVQQVEEDIRTGKTERRQAYVEGDGDNNPDDFLSTGGLPRPGRGKRKKQSKEEFTALREYTARERIELLIDAMERAIEGAVRIETTLLEQKAFSHIDQIVLASEGETDILRLLDARDSAIRSVSVQRLIAALGALRAEVRNGH